MLVLHVIGARPNFMKFAPVYHALAKRKARQLVVHTGQHYDFNMSDVFFQELRIPAPDFNLQVGSSTHAQQTADIISRFEPVLLDQKADAVLVYGDVNSTVAAALVCAKLGVCIGHVEAGLRSFDRSMPEEINRLLTDQISDLLFTPSEDGNRNLAREGVDPAKVHLVGNAMIDTLLAMLPKAKERIPADTPQRFVLVTLHRPSNVDDLSWLSSALQTLAEVGQELPVLFPVHPRTRAHLEKKGMSCRSEGNVKLLDPLPYVDFLGLQTRATVVITDSGGIQEETTVLGVPCLTVRENTERPITVEMGTNVLVGRSMDVLRRELNHILAGQRKSGRIPPLWDGRTGERIAQILLGEKTATSVRQVTSIT